MPRQGTPTTPAGKVALKSVALLGQILFGGAGGGGPGGPGGGGGDGDGGGGAGPAAGDGADPGGPGVDFMHLAEPTPRIHSMVPVELQQCALVVFVASGSYPVQHAPILASFSLKAHIFFEEKKREKR